MNHPVSLVLELSRRKARSREAALGAQSRVGPSFAEDQERARYGCTFSFGWHPSVGRIARFPVRGHASQKEAHDSSDEGRGSRDGEPVRVQVTSSKGCLLHGVTTLLELTLSGDREPRRHDGRRSRTLPSKA